MTAPEDPYRQAYGAVPSTDQFNNLNGGYPAVSPGYGPPPSPRNGGSNTVVVVVLTVVVVAVILVLGVLAWLVFRDDGGSDSTARPEASVATVTERAPNAAQGEDAPAAAPAPMPAPAPVRGLPTGATPCGSVYGSTAGYSTSAAGTTVTSCPFAEEVRLAYARSGPRGGSRLITAVSPTTGNVYDMNCVAGVSVVTCAGGDNAVVYLY